MEFSGRTYIFFAATLLLLTGSIAFYEQQKEEQAGPGTVVTRAQAVAACDRNAVKLESVRIGCRTQTGDARVREVGTSRPSLGGGAKFVSAGGN